MEERTFGYKDLADSAYWKDRRTIRNFSDADVSDELLFNLIEKASKAPTTGGMQLYSAIITRDGDILKNLKSAHFNQPAARNAKLIITIIADFNRFEKWCILRGAKPGFGNFESFVAALLDATIFAQQLTTLMEVEGLGVCWLGTATYTASKIGEILKLPRHTVPVAALAIGWPADNGTEAERLPTGSIVHKEIYNDYTPDRIEEIFAEKEAIEANKNYIKENGVPSLAHVFTEIRYPETNAITFSKDYFDYIEQQGFLFPDKTSRQ